MGSYPLGSSRSRSSEAAVHSVYSNLETAPHGPPSKGLEGKI